MKLAGKVAIVTGAGGAGVGGLGVTYVQALAANGASVVVRDLDGEAAQRTAAALVADGGTAIGVRCDVTSDDDIDAMVRAAVEAFGGIDILVNNAGLAAASGTRCPHSAARTGVTSWTSTRSRPCAVLPRYARSCAARGGGSIVNQSSNGSQMEAGSYTVSKYAIDAVTRGSGGGVLRGQHPCQRHRARHDDGQDAAGAGASHCSPVRPCAARAGPKTSSARCCTCALTTRRS